MTDKEKLQSLIDAAMRSPEPPTASLKRAVPVAAIAKPPVETVSTENPVKTETEVPPVEAFAESLEKATAEELGWMLDERIRRDQRKRRIEVLVTTVVLLGSAVGGTLWFVQDKERMDSVQKAMQEIRMASDPEAMAPQYNGALEKIAARGTQLDGATAGMGVDPNKDHSGDVYMEAGMKQMMGDDSGPTVDQRCRLLTQTFGDVSEKGLR